MKDVEDEDQKFQLWVTQGNDCSDAQSGQEMYKTSVEKTHTRKMFSLFEKLKQHKLTAPPPLPKPFKSWILGFFFFEKQRREMASKIAL